MPRQQEKNIVNAIIKMINALPNSHARKTHGGMYSSGEPDIDAVVQGRAVKLEVKAPGGKATPLQEARLRTWAHAGAVTGVVESVMEARVALQAAGLV